MTELSEDTLESLQRLKDVIQNREQLRQDESLEEKWVLAYQHAPCFRDIPFSDLKMMFDACDRNKLLGMYPLPQREVGQSLNPFTVFRGCVGSEFQPGMSWTTCLYQAIKYPKGYRTAGYYNNGSSHECSVWVALVEPSEIYCYLTHYEPEFIVCPKACWKIDIPQEKFA
jgi:hypothetical protein